MKVLVGIKRVIDYQAKIRVNRDQTGIETSHVKMSMNPFDEIAVEEAVRLKEQGIAQEVIVVSIGTRVVEETLRKALALGADRALLIQTENTLEPLHVAQLLQILINKESPELVILGKQAIDDDCNQTGQMLAGLLGWAQATFVSKLTVDSDWLQVVREIDGGLETIRVMLPAVVTTDLRLNEPRYTSLPNIMKAKTKPLEVIDATALGAELQPHSEVIKVTAPPQREAGITVDNIVELMDKLKNDAKVIQ